MAKYSNAKATNDKKNENKIKMSPKKKKNIPLRQRAREKKIFSNENAIQQIN